MKITIGIINFNLPEHTYYLIKSIRKQCKGEYDICVFDTSTTRPIYSKADEVRIINNTKSQYFNAEWCSEYGINNRSFECIADAIDSDWLIMINSTCLVKSDLIKINFDDSVLMMSDIEADGVQASSDIAIFNLKKIKELRYKYYDSSEDYLYCSIKKSVGSQFKRLNTNDYVIKYNESINNHDAFNSWLYSNGHIWKPQYLDVVVSLTTFKGRLYDQSTYNVLVALLQQNTKYKYKVAVVLSREEFGYDFETPGFLIRLSKAFKNKLEIIWTDKNTKPLKKLDPTMEKYPDIPIITLDDDDICDSNLVEYVMNEHIKDPYYTLGTWIEQTPNFVKWVAGVRLFPPNCLYKFPLEDYYRYYDGILDDNFNAMRCAFKLTPVKEISTEHNTKTNQTDLKLTREYLNTPWGEYYKRFIIAHLDEIPEELYYE